MSETETAASQPAAEELSPSMRVVPGVDFPLPPGHLREQLLNEPGGGAAEPQPAPKASAPAFVLDYIDGVPQTVIPLKYPFRLDGTEVREITVRALTVEETAAVVRGKGAESIAVFDFYAAMTGLPGDVVRALPGDDGQALVDAAYDFLPRWMRGGSAA